MLTRTNSRLNTQLPAHMKPLLRIRSHPRAGDDYCAPWDTNCVAIYAGKRAMNDDGTAVWDNCARGRLGAGLDCIDAVANSKYVGFNKQNLADCMKC